MCTWVLVPLFRSCFLILLLYSPNIAKLSESSSQNCAKIDNLCNMFLSFFRSHFASIFCWLLVDFKSFETLKIVLPCRREHDFCKIAVFTWDFKTMKQTINNCQKNVAKSSENRAYKLPVFQEHMVGIRLQKPLYFLLKFCRFFHRFWDPKSTQKVK